jgi:hypothetical protein
MVKKLTKHGNSLALVIDRAVLDLLKIRTIHLWTCPPTAKY